MARNLKELEVFQSYVSKSDAPKLIIAYIDKPEEATYNLMKAALLSVIADPSLNLVISRAGGDSPRILVGNADHHVIFDSKNTDSSPEANRNTHANAGKTINENHFTRLAIATSMLSNSGHGSQQKLSSSTGKFETRLSHRLGKTPIEATGFVAVSFAIPT